MSVLVIEDSDSDFEILINSIPKRFDEIAIERVRSGELAIANLYGCLQQSTHLPIFILLDLNLVGISGFETVSILKSHATLKRIPIIVLSISNSEADILRSYELGVSAYFVKPKHFEDSQELVELIFQYWAVAKLNRSINSALSSTRVYDKLEGP